MRGRAVTNFCGGPTFAVGGAVGGGAGGCRCAVPAGEIGAEAAGFAVSAAPGCGRVAGAAPW